MLRFCIAVSDNEDENSGISETIAAITEIRRITIPGEFGLMLSSSK